MIRQSGPPGIQNPAVRSTIRPKRSPLNKDKNIAEPAGGRMAFMIQKELKKL